MHRLVLAVLIPLAVGLTACDEEELTPPPAPPDLSPADGAAPASALAQCAPIEAIGCGDFVWGDTADPNSGHTTVLDHYPVAPGNFAGPEVAWAFVADRTEEVTFRLVDPRPTEVNHDLLVLAGDGACRADRALVRGHNDVTFEAVAGERYYLLLDGFAGDAGPFDAQLVCDGEPTPDAPPAPADPCADVRGLWDTDPLQPVAECTAVLDGAVPDDGWPNAAPDSPLEAGALCLARGVWGLNGRSYYVLSGTLDPVDPQLPDDRGVYSVAFVDGDGSHAAEGSGGVVFFGEALGSPIIDPGDFTTEARWHAADDTLLYRYRLDGWGLGDSQLIHSAAFDCPGPTG